MNCSKQNFSGKDIELDSLKFVQDLESQDVDTLVENIVSTLREKDFSVDINSSNNPDEYEDSVKKLISSIKDTLSESNKLKFEFKGGTLNTFSRRLTELLTPPKKTKVDLNVEAIIPSEGMLSQDKVNALKFNEVLVDIFGNNLTIRSFGEQQFRKKLLTLTIIDTENKQIIDGVPTLNDRLMRFKADEYLKLKRFIETLEINGNHFDSDLIANSYYLG